MKNQVNLQLLTSLSFLHSCLRLDYIAGRSYLIHPESLPSVFPACAHPAFQMPATTAVQESWLNPFSTHVESRRRVSLQTKTGCRSIRVAPRGSNSGMCRNYVFMPTSHIYQNGEMDQRTELLRPSPRTFYAFRSLVQLNLLSLHRFIIIEHLSYSLVEKLHNGCLPKYLKSKQYLVHNRHPIFAKWSS